MPVAKMLEPAEALDRVESFIPARRNDESARWNGGSVWILSATLLLAALTVVGILARIILSKNSLGSDDAFAWEFFAMCARDHGLIKTYQLFKDMNHPPLAVIWARLALWITGRVHIVNFQFVFRLAPIAADVGSCVVLYKILRKRTERRIWGWVAAAAFAWNLDAIMDGAFHGNTDNIVAFFTLMAAFQLDRRRFFLGGLALAAAINVKIVPVLLIPAFLSLCHDWPSFRRFVGGLTLGAIPFLVVICVIPHVFISNVFGYNSAVGEWGFMLFSMYSQYIPLLSGRAVQTTAWFREYGKYIVFAVAIGIGLLSWRMPRWNAFQIGAIAWCGFLVFTPGWGLQYSVYVVPLLMAVNLIKGSCYGLAAGLYLLTAYAGAWHGLPLNSRWTFSPPHGNPLPVPLGLVAWSILLGFFCVSLWRGIFPPRPVLILEAAD